MLPNNSHIAFGRNAGRVASLANSMDIQAAQVPAVKDYLWNHTAEGFRSVRT